MTTMELMQQIYEDLHVRNVQLNIEHVKKFHAVLRTGPIQLRYQQQVEIASNLVESYKAGRVGISPDIFVEEKPRRVDSVIEARNVRSALYGGTPKQVSYKGFRLDNADMITYGIMCVYAIMRIEQKNATPDTVFPTAGYNPNKV